MASLSDRLRKVVDGLPPGAAVTLPADVLRDWIELEGEPEYNDAPVIMAPEPSWRERLWTAPAEARIGKAELLEAVGRPRSWLYRHTGAKATNRIPHRKLDGELVFVVGEVREWLREHEDIIMGGPID